MGVEGRGVKKRLIPERENNEDGKDTVAKKKNQGRELGRGLNAERHRYLGMRGEKSSWWREEIVVI